MEGVSLAVGLMSGTSADGVDAALLLTDGDKVIDFQTLQKSFPKPSLFVPYDLPLKHRLQTVMVNGFGADDAQKLEQDITNLQAEAVSLLLAQNNLQPSQVRVIGFHGQTVRHAPHEHITTQLADGSLLAEKTGIDVVTDFRRRDVAVGGQGAPLVPVFHAALLETISRSLPSLLSPLSSAAVLNIGGVSNATFWFTPTQKPLNEGSESFEQRKLVAMDCGPGNGLIDSWVQTLSQNSLQMDLDGSLARSGSIDQNVVSETLKHPYFALEGPKSLDRFTFSHLISQSSDQPSGWKSALAGQQLLSQDHDYSFPSVQGKSLEDGAATLTEITAEAIASSARSASTFALSHFGSPVHPVRLWLVCGGGRKNSFLMESLRRVLNHEGNEGDEVKVIDIDDLSDQLGWKIEGDMLEAQAFAYLAVRSLSNLPLTFPSTTGCSRPVSGGALYRF